MRRVLCPSSLWAVVPLRQPQRHASSYSTFGHLMKRKKKDAGGDDHHHAPNPATSGGGGSGVGLGKYPVQQQGRPGRRLQSVAQDRHDAQRLFPRTLPSGRPEQLNTRAQQIFMSDPRRAEEVLEQQAKDAEYVRRVREMESGKGADRRFMRGFNDYTEIQDPDAYASIFGESKGTERLRTAAWQRQFEAENEGVELPYERTNIMARWAPNWFVRYFLNLRDGGGADHLYMIAGCASVCFTLLGLVGYLFYTSPSRARPISEVR